MLQVESSWKRESMTGREVIEIEGMVVVTAEGQKMRLNGSLAPAKDDWSETGHCST